MKIISASTPKKTENKHFLAQSLIVAIAISAACGCSDDKKNTPAPSPECTIDDQCAGNLDGRTKCSSDGVCVEPQIIQKDCNNNVADGNEQCDGTDLRGKSCTDVGSYAGGTLKCTSTCSFDVSDCYECMSETDCEGRTDGKTQCDTANKVCIMPSAQTCNNDNTADDGELCDGTDLRNKSCSDVGAFAGGTLKCSSTCNFDTSDCYECMAEADCATRTDGKTQCDTDNKVCVLPGLQIICDHNNVADEDESCDGTDLRGKQCSDMGSYAGGELKCNNDCSFDISGCFECVSSADCEGRLDGKTECDNVSHTCLEPGTTQAHFEWLTDYSCGMDTFEGNVSYSAMTSENHAVYGLIWVKGCTENKQWCDKVVDARVHYVDASTISSMDPKQWPSVSAGRNSMFDFSGNNQNNNEYMSTLRFSDAGQYLYVYSFDLKNNPNLDTEKPQTVFCYAGWAADASPSVAGHASITAPPACNNDILEQGESCDTNQLNGKTCASWTEFVDGTLACNKSCDFDTSACVECTSSNLTKCGANQECREGHCVDKAHEITCGDDLVEGSEQCDKTNFNGKSCADFDGFAGGDLSCDSSCKFVTDGCFECNSDRDCEGRGDGKTRCAGNTCDDPLPEAAVVISQIYTGGGNSGSTYKTKFIELFNRSAVSQTLSGWSIQYGTAIGNSLSRCDLPSSVILPAGGYYLVALASGAYGAPLSIGADHTCSDIDPAAQSGKFFLVPSNATLPSATPASGYIDGIGYGNANWFEGSSATGMLNTTNAALRNGAGCDDTDNNADDFTLGTPTPRSSGTSIHLCSLSPENTDAACHDGRDNDGDSKTDCDDSDCYDFCYSPENTDAACHDTFDNDGDGKTDCDDPECRSFCLEPENTEAKCKDGIDNDGNDLTDCEDSSCASFCSTECPGENQTYLPAYNLCAHNIATKNDLIALRDTWNQYGGTEYVIDADKPVAFVLTKNIGLGAQSDWIPIGNAEHPFNAIFIGNERTVGGNLTCSDASCGLFGVLDGAQIRNVQLKQLTIVANTTVSDAAFLAGSAKDSVIEDIVIDISTMSTAAKQSSGSLFGSAENLTAKNISVSNIEIVNTSGIVSNSSIGGFIAYLKGDFDIKKISFSGNVKKAYNSYLGGFIEEIECADNCNLDEISIASSSVSLSYSVYGRSEAGFIRKSSGGPLNITNTSLDLNVIGDYYRDSSSSYCSCGFICFASNVHISNLKLNIIYNYKDNNATHFFIFGYETENSTVKDSIITTTLQSSSDYSVRIPSFLFYKATDATITNVNIKINDNDAKIVGFLKTNMSNSRLFNVSQEAQNTTRNYNVIMYTSVMENVLIRNIKQLILDSGSTTSIFDTFLSNMDVTDLVTQIGNITTVSGKDVMQFASETEAVTKLNAKLADEAENGGNLDSGQYAPWFINGETGKAELNLSADRSQWYTVE